MDKEEATKRAESIIDTFDVNELPPHMRDPIIRYVRDGILTGGFLTAVMENNLWAAFQYADAINKSKIGDIIDFCHHYLPTLCWGDESKVDEWIKTGGLIGRFMRRAKEKEKV